MADDCGHTLLIVQSSPPPPQFWFSLHMHTRNGQMEGPSSVGIPQIALSEERINPWASATPDPVVSKMCLQCSNNNK